jgi:ABC-type glycerol-3-phosphate transport system permease component
MLVVLGITTFMRNYNNFLWTLVSLQSPENFTLARSLGDLVSAGNSNPSFYPIMLAGSVIVSLPLVIIFFVLQKYIIGGLSAGAVKE